MPEQKSHSQSYLTETMQKFGFTSDSGGVCEGYVMKGIDAFLSDDLHTFNKRVLLLQAKHNELVKIKERLDKKLAELAEMEKLGHRARDLKLTSAEKKLYDVMAFFNGIELYYQPGLYEPWLGNKAGQGDVEVIAPMATSQRVEETGGLFKLKGPVHAYGNAELAGYINALDEIARRENQDLIVKFDYLNSESDMHTIALVYEAKSNGWKIIDANHPELADTVFMAKDLPTLMKMFFDNKDSKMMLASSFYTVGKNKDNLLGMLEQVKAHQAYQDAHMLTQEVASYTTPAGVTLAHAAAKYADKAILEELHKRGELDFEALSAQGQSPLMWAAKLGRAAIFDFALEQKIDITSLLNPFFSACLYGNAEIVRIYAKHGVDLNAEVQGKSAASLAAEGGHVEVLKVLHEFGVDLSGPHLQKVAEEAGRYEVVKFLQQLPAKQEDKKEETTEQVTPSAPPVVRLDRSQVISLQKLGAKQKSPEPLSRRPSSESVVELKVLIEEKSQVEKDAKLIELRLHSIINSLDIYRNPAMKANPQAKALLSTCDELSQRCSAAIAEYKVNKRVDVLKKITAEITHVLDHEVSDKLKNRGQSLFRPANDSVFMHILTNAAPRSQHSLGLAERVKKSTDPMNSIQIVSRTPKKTLE